MSSVNRFAVGGCRCGPPSCVVPIHVTGCGGSFIPGATVTVWTNSSKAVQIATGTTDSGGTVNLDLGAAGTYYREVSRVRFTTATATSTYVCGSGYGVALTTATGYACLPGCGIPIPLTLYGTSTTFGALTFVLNRPGWAGSWTALVSYSYPGCSGCGATTIGVIISLVAVDGRLQMQWAASGGCPDPFSGSPVFQYIAISLTCPPAFTITGSFTPAAGSAAAKLLCQSTTPEVVTITE